LGLWRLAEMAWSRRNLCNDESRLMDIRARLLRLFQDACRAAEGLGENL